MQIDYWMASNHILVLKVLLAVTLVDIKIEKLTGDIFPVCCLNSISSKFIIENPRMLVPENFSLSIFTVVKSYEVKWMVALSESCFDLLNKYIRL